MTTQVLIEQAESLRRAGRMSDAEAIYRRVVASDPRNVDALLGLVQLLLDRRDFRAASKLLRSGVSRFPDRAELHLAFGIALAAEHKMTQAIASLERAMSLAPSLPESHFQLGQLLEAQGRLLEAIASYERAVSLAPQVPELRLVLGNAYAKAERWNDAEHHYRAAISLRHDFATAHMNLGNVLKAQGRWLDARACYEQALALREDSADAYYNLGNLLHREGDLDGAFRCQQRALALRPDWPDAAHSLGNVVRVLRGAAASLDYYRLALRNRPEFFEAQLSIGSAFEGLSQFQEANSHYRKALALQPDSATALERLVYSKLSLCDWSGLNEDINRLRALVGTGEDVRPFTFLALPGVGLLEQRAVASHYALEQMAANAARQFVAPSANVISRSRLKIGYFSADLHEHATAYLMAEVFERHDRKGFEITAYSFGIDDSSPMRARLKAAFEHFIDVRELSYPEVARRIRDDDIDILVDLKGYTEHHRAPVLAMRPAPIQVSYLGYPGTSGAPFIDYLVADRVVVPKEHFGGYTEAIAWLPGCYQCNDSLRQIGAIPDRAACRLPDGAFVFACLNQPYKITPEIFAAWCRLLKRIPFSIVWLLRANSTTERNLCDSARQNSVDPERLVFADRLPHTAHLARLAHADIYLDTTPCGAHTLASDVLWAGVPLVTITGDTFASRVAASLLTPLGFDDLIAKSFQEYETIAYELANDRERLLGLRARLQRHRASSPLFDGARVARGLESLYEEMWRRHAAGLPASHIALEGSGD